jgi:predicted GIY-YIG superfamily endonuclease
MTFCYILKLNSGKYYVGKTESIEERMVEHYSGEGAKWTQLYYPVEILEIVPFTHKWQESYTTLILMKKYGVENVRGGPWCMINLQFRPKLHLLDETKTIHENYETYTVERKSKYKEKNEYLN